MKWTIINIIVEVNERRDRKWLDGSDGATRSSRNRTTCLHVSVLDRSYNTATLPDDVALLAIILLRLSQPYRNS